MKKIRLFIGRLLAWATLPLAIVVLRGSHRTRVMIVSNNKLLVVKTFIHHGRWSLPGGGVHNGESSFDGALRELKEETGVTLTRDELTFVGEKPFSSYGVSTLNTYFLARLPKKTPLMHNFEIIESDWIDISSINHKTCEKDILEGLSLVRSL